MQRRQVVVRDTRRTTLSMYAGWLALLIRRVEPHGESFACHTHAKNQLLKWKYSCLLGPQIKMHMADDNTNRAACPSLSWAWSAVAAALLTN